MVTRRDVHSFDYIFPQNHISPFPWENPIPELPTSPAIAEAKRLVPSKDWYLKRPFFKMLAQHPELLKLWIAQECCVSTPFTQVMAKAASRFQDPGIRWILFEVVTGELGDEYGSPKDLVAPITGGDLMRAFQAVENGEDPPLSVVDTHNRNRATAHALLSDNLRASLGVPIEWVTPLPETQTYLDSMWALLDESCSGVEVLAWFGEGQEAAIENEYSALKEAGAAAFAMPGAEAFPDANINEDYGHRAKFRKASSALIMSNPTLELQELAGEMYVEAARRAHFERGTLYYDELARTAEIWLRDPELLSALGKSNPEFTQQYLAWVDGSDPAVEHAVLELAGRELGQYVNLHRSPMWQANDGFQVD